MVEKSNADPLLPGTGAVAATVGVPSPVRLAAFFLLLAAAAVFAARALCDLSLSPQRSSGGFLSRSHFGASPPSSPTPSGAESAELPIFFAVLQSSCSFPGLERAEQRADWLAVDTYLELARLGKPVSLALRRKPPSQAHREKRSSLALRRKPPSLARRRKPASLARRRKPPSLACRRKPTSLAHV